MSCLISKEILNDFHDNYIMPSIRVQRMDLYINCVQRCQKIISIYRSAFPCDCAQLDLLLILIKQHLIDMNKCLVAMEEVVKYMYDHFDEIYKTPKIFISHSTDDKPIVERFVTMLEQIGVKQDQLFCSSVTGYGIPQGAGDLYDFIRSEMSNDNLFVIMMLSQNYYNSPVCLNEMGAAWIKQSAYQSILLPGFQYSEIKGAVNPRAMSFNLTDKENRNYALNELKDRIVAHLGMDNIAHSLWERFRDKFTAEIDQAALMYSRSKTAKILPKSAILDNISTDDEKIVLYYILSKKIRKLKGTDVELWLKADEIYDINIENAFDLLSTLGDCKTEDGTLEFDATMFRELIASSDKIMDELRSCFLFHQHLSSEHFIRMWEAGKFDDVIKLFVSYIIDEKTASFGDRWMAEAQIEDIKIWENKYSLDDLLSQNYGACLNLFIQNHFVYESDWTSYGNPRGHKLYSSLEKLLFDEFPYIDEVRGIKRDHMVLLPF